MEPESPGSIDQLIMKDLTDRFAKGYKLTIQVNGIKRSSIKQKRFMLNMFDDENVSNGHILLPLDTPSPYLIKRGSLNSSQKKMHEQSIANCQGTTGRRIIMLGFQSSVDSCLSVYGQV
eukprot:TRINITY_DN4429_c0_g1_i1.p1 TRINITY_DN4429_c0_g1~~TRINITY_DN4429_c0_g1_i1.p1  ORF type:complete len:119 (-),score=3.29 TRINITY_DN4429_c0_g1_i1:334-690(-)